MVKRTCIVTGGSSGIGQAVVELFINSGYQVFNLDITEGHSGRFLFCDITDHTSVIEIIQKIAEKHAIDTLVASAGVHFSANIEETSEQDLQRVFDINVKGTYSAVQAVLPSMKEREAGSIIVIASDQALVAKRNSRN